MLAYSIREQKNHFPRRGREGLTHIDLILLLDFFQEDRLILNGVGITLKLWPSNNSFRLMYNSLQPNEKVRVVDASLKVCIQLPNPALLMAHNKLLENIRPSSLSRPLH